MKGKEGYYKYLDGYRFIAVSLVIITHWLPSYFDKYPFSKIGVDMFFVLSGFLITEILLKQKKEFSKNEIYNRKKIYISFYIRRALRIFPIYYLTILFFLIINAPLIKENLFYFLFYLSNIVILNSNDWIGMFSHLWSLAIEEQFYIFWPILIISIPLKYLGYFIVFGISISLLYVLFSRSLFPSVTIYSCLSTLSTGALLAYLKISASSYHTSKRYDLIIITLSLFILSFLSFGIFRNSFLLHFSSLTFSFYLIKILVNSTSKFFDIFLNNSLIFFLGKISYGLYLYHNFIPWLLRNLNGTENKLIFIKNPFFSPFKSGWMILSMQAFLLLFISISSWYLIERPINNLKRNFKYS